MKMPRGLHVISLSVLLCGCSNAIIKPASVPVCELPPALANSCELPPQIGASLTYGQLIQLDLKTRENLGTCAARFDKLRDSYQSCIVMLKGYNARLDQAGQALNQPQAPGAAGEHKSQPSK